ncbi:hypothetical protein BGX24_010816, partial [Mortierella sp. AD032]
PVPPRMGPLHPEQPIPGLRPIEFPPPGPRPVVNPNEVLSPGAHQPSAPVIPGTPEIVMPNKPILPNNPPHPAPAPARKPDQPPMPDPPTAAPSPTPSSQPLRFGSVPVLTEFPAAAFALESPEPRPSAILNPVRRRRALESPQPCMSQVESFYDTYPTGTTKTFVISSASGNLSSQNNAATGSMIGAVFALIALTAVGVSVVRGMKKPAIDIRDIESLGYESRRPVEKSTDDSTSRF